MSQPIQNPSKTDQIPQTRPTTPTALQKPPILENHKKHQTITEPIKHHQALLPTPIRNHQPFNG